MAYQRIKTFDNITRMNTALYDNLQDGIDEALSASKTNANNVSELSDEVTGGDIPTYWEEYLQTKIEFINSLHIAGGKNCFSFPLITDIHIRQNLGKYSGILVRRILDECYLPFALCCGDIVNRGSGGETDMDTDFATAEELLIPIRDRLLQTQGNHDGSWGYKDYNGDGTMDYYSYNFTPEKLHSLIYRKVGLVGECHFDTSGTGYYIDDVSNKVRYIMLNTHNNPYEEDEDGFAVYNNMWKFKFQQSQYDLVVEALSTVPADDWCVISASHVPLSYSTTGTLPLMAKVLAAYRNKTVISDNYTGEAGYDAITVDADFTNAKGEFVGHFAGHEHKDEFQLFNGITVSTTRCDGANENSEDGLEAKVVGTTTEQSFDVFTINKTEKRIYVTKIGAGTNRYWDYKNGVTFNPDEVKIIYEITTNLSKCTADTSNATSIETDESITLLFTVSEGYELPEIIIVSGADYTWDKSTGTLVLSNPTADVIITINAGGYTNLINTISYADDIRLSTSDGVSERDITGYTITGVIEVPACVDSKPHIIRTSGVNFNNETYANAGIYAYNAETDAFVSFYKPTTTVGGYTFTLDDNGNLTIEVRSSVAPVDLRLCGYGSGANLIVTLDEEIA